MKIIQIYKEFQSLKTVEEKISYLEMLSYCNMQFNINFDNIIRKLENKQLRKQRAACRPLLNNKEKLYYENIKSKTSQSL